MTQVARMTQVAVLPQDDPKPESREQALAKARADYVYDHGYQDVVLSEHVAEGEKFETAYLVQTVGIYTKLAANRAAIGMSRSHDVNADGKTDPKERLDLLRATLKSFPTKSREPQSGRLSATRHGGGSFAVTVAGPIGRA